MSTATDPTETLPITRSQTKKRTTASSSINCRAVKPKKRPSHRAATMATVATVATAAVIPKGVRALSSGTTSPHFSPIRDLSSFAFQPSRTTSPLFSSSTNNNEVASQPKPKKSTPRTKSFEALWAGNLPFNATTTTSSPLPKIHTLILGTHPSITSLSENKYFAHPMNAFWWIAGDCLGFRRNHGISSSSGTPYKFTKSLRYGPDRIIPYSEQIQKITSNGFALWDIVQSCEREGSLDSSIRNEMPNDIRSFCDRHVTIERIVFANGVGGCKFFQKHFRDWWEEEDSELMPGDDDMSRSAFSKKYRERKKGRIKCVCAIAVSPANAKFTYEEKRDCWEEVCYKPGLEDHERLESSRLRLP